MRSIFFYKPDPRDLDRQSHTSRLWSVDVWLPAIIAIVCIAWESTPTFSSQQTSGWLRPLVEKVFGSLDDAVWAEGNHIFRKTAHFCGYGLVCLTFLRAWLLTFGTRFDLSYKSWRLRSCLAAILCTACCASLDEIHQSFLPSRTGQVSDVLLDTCGASFLCLFMWFAIWRRRRWESLR